MAIVKMKHLRLLAMQSDREGLLKQLQRLGCVEIDEPADPAAQEHLSSLTRPGGEGLAAGREGYAAAEHALATLKRRCPEKGGLFRNRAAIRESELFDEKRSQAALSVARAINEAERRIHGLYAERGKRNGQKLVLQPWLGLDVPLDAASSGQTAIQFGTIPLQVSFEQVAGSVLAASELADLVLAGADKDAQYLLLVCHSSALDGVLEALKEHGWTRANLREWSGTAAENDRRLDGRLAEISQEIEGAQKEIAALSHQRESLRLLLDRLKQDIQREEARARLLDTDTAFLMEGWVSAAQWPEVERLLEGLSCAWEIRDPQPDEYPRVPVQLKNNFLTRPLNMVTEMYSLPAYDGIDPNPLMAPFFILFYGIMMADMGYGLLMMLASVFMLKKLRPKKGMHNFLSLLGLCGISTFVVGAITGGFFGDMIYQLIHMLNPASTFSWFYTPLFTPLDDTLMILIGAMALGGIHIVTGMAISLIKKLTEKKYADAIFEEVTWWLILAGTALAVLGTTNLLLFAGTCLLVVGCFAQSWKPGDNLFQSVFGMVAGGSIGLLGSLYNHVTGYFGDILSYSRLMALMLAGSVIAQVFNTLGAIPGNLILFFVISMAGNALNFALNLLGCYVHDLRLQCLEYFGKFYQDGGRPFRPLNLDTRFVDIID